MSTNHFSDLFSTFPENESLFEKWIPSKTSTSTYFPKSSPQWNPYEFEKIQTYIPLYSKLQSMTPPVTDLNNVVLSCAHSFHDLHSVISYQEIKPKSMFVKFSPLLDPLRYLTGKYGGSTKDFPLLKELPIPDYEIKGKSPFQKAIRKIYDSNNVSYVDGFFYYLSSQLIHNHSFLHGIDFYGSFLAVQNKFRINIYDDISYLRRYSYFNDNLGKFYHIHDQTFLKYLEFENCNKSEGRSSRKHHKTKLDITSVKQSLGNASDVLDLLQIEDLSYDEITESPTLTVAEIIPETLDNTFFAVPTISKFEKKNESSPQNSSSEEEDEESEDDDEQGEQDESDDDSSDCPPVDDEENETLYAYLDDFPVQMICMETCEGTLDQLFVDQTLNPSNYDTEGASMLFQVVASLIAYQKAFRFTHNDLHTNNIMWVSTPIKYIYYQIQGRNYRIPTYNRIYKIIDFGRSIYEFKGQRFCSDSFASPEGDASTQYNCEPYLVPNKPVIEPNPSFDLCRLACAIYDFVMDPDLSDDEYEEDTDNDEDDIQHLDKDLLATEADDEDDEDDEDQDEVWEDTGSEENADEPETQFAKTIAQWCEDDKGKNMLYKSSGQERYPCFKLYQMIARTVHKHIPIEQIHNPLFAPFLLPDIAVKLKKNDVQINLDSIPVYSS